MKIELKLVLGLNILQFVYRVLQNQFLPHRKHTVYCINQPVNVVRDVLTVLLSVRWHVYV
jgi:hypothetical protein